MVQRVGNVGECRQMWGDAYKKGCKENNVRILSWWSHGQSGAKLQISRMHMDCREIVGKGQRLEEVLLSAWLWRCRVSVGEVKGRTFVKLFES